MVRAPATRCPSARKSFCSPFAHLIILSILTGFPLHGTPNHPVRLMGVRHSRHPSRDDEIAAAAASGDVARLQELIRPGMTYGRSRRGNTALNMAIFNNQEQAFQHLLESGADPNLVDADGYGPLVIATRRADPRFVQPLLDAGVDVNKRHKHHAVGRDPRGESGWTALHEAAWMNSAEIIDMLLESGADPHVITKLEGATPLHLAASWGRAPAASSLLHGGANLWLRNNQGQTSNDVATGSACHVIMLWKLRLLTAVQRLVLAQACCCHRLAHPAFANLPYDALIEVAAQVGKELPDEETYSRFIYERENG